MIKIHHFSRLRLLCCKPTSQNLLFRQAQDSAYGEDYIYQRINSWNVPYTFSGKERDSETGYSYFGARYYASDESVWLSVDPLSDKYPSTSGYMYVMGRPTALIDPNGMNTIRSDAEMFEEGFKEDLNNSQDNQPNGFIKFADLPKANSVGEFLSGAAKKLDEGDKISGTELYEFIDPDDKKPGEKALGEILDKIDYLEVKKDGDETYFNIKLKGKIKEASLITKDGDTEYKVTISNKTQLIIQTKSSFEVNLDVNHLSVVKLGFINMSIPLSAIGVNINKDNLEISVLGINVVEKKISLPKIFKR